MFEFAYNAEFSGHNKASLVAMPYMPTQVKEKDLAYDVKFRLKNAKGKVRSLMLQHKVVRFVNGYSPTNKKRIAVCKGPYFAMELDTEQYNRILALRARGRAVYYCAPCFVRRFEMETHYSSRTLCKASVWVDIAPAGKITDKKCHALIVDASAKLAFRCSGEPLEAQIVEYESGDKNGPGEEFEMTLAVASRMYEDLFAIASNRAIRPQVEQGDEQTRIRTDRPRRREIQNVEDAAIGIAELASQYFGLSWILVREADACPPAPPRESR